MAAILGLYGTGDFAANQAPENWRETILMLDPNGDSPLTALSSMMATEATTDPRFHWWEKDYEARHLVQSGGALSTDTSIAVVAKANFAPAGTLINVPRTGEQILITVDPSGDTTLGTATRGYAGTTAAALLDGDQMTIIGNVHEEGSGAPTAINRNPVEYTNYTQIWKEAMEHTRTEALTKTRTGDNVTQQRLDAMKRHAQNMERGFFFGAPSVTTGTKGKPQRTTGGLLYALKHGLQQGGGGAAPAASVVDLAGVGTLKDLDTFFQSLFAFGSQERLGFVGNKFISQLNFLVENNVQYVVNDPIQVYGMELDQLKTPYGRLLFRRHPLLTTDPWYNNSGWFISPENMKFRTITDTVLKENIQLPDEDGTKDQFLTEAGFEIHLIKTFGLITNL